ncbi:hypothetical protein ACH4MG_15680 [Streptomyces sp. NPDC017454]|uniref:hypothetical protein n=1 Tax=Streptomyces sp. NPDC017454 TaxID=3364997 RepID=UPI0037BE12B0
MGIESDQVVYEYLSRVGDVAQQRQLPSATRMRLVSELRNEIDRHRAKTTVDSPAAVRRILDRLGSPYDIVDAAGGTSGGSGPGGAPQPSAPPPAAVPVQPEGGPRKAEGGPRKPGGGPRKAERLKGLRRAVPRPRPATPEPGTAPSPPHLAGADELGSGGGVTQPDWWRVDNGPFGGGLDGGLGGGFGGGGDSVPGFVGGVEIPELLKPPPRDMGDAAGAARRNGAAEKAEVVEEAGEPAAVDTGGARRRRLPRLWPEGGWNNPLLLLAAALLVAGAVAGSLVPLGLGWLIAYLSRRLTPAQSKWAVLGLPGMVAAGGVVWLWGRTEGRWGAPIAEGHMNDAVAETWPLVLRTAAVATALYLLWRSRRPRS